MNETRGLPSVVDTISGRIPVNPPLYYEMRIRIGLRKIKDDKDFFEEYDNVAAAYDRLGNHFEAKALLRQKFERLTALGIQPGNDPIEDPWYRYYANMGTVRAHEWLAKFKEGVPPDSPEQVARIELAISDIEAAIGINPRAHFGREIIQLRILRQLSQNPELLQVRFAVEDYENYKFSSAVSPKHLAEGLAGIARFGGNPDSALLMMFLYSNLNDSWKHLKALAYWRAMEISGKTDASQEPIQRLGLGNDRENVLKYQYKVLREDAETYRKHYHDYVMAKLKDGQHPDTNPEFWRGYVEPARVNYAAIQLNPLQKLKRELTKEPLKARLIAFALVALSGAGTLAWLRSRRIAAA